MNVLSQVHWTWQPSIFIGFSLWTLLYHWFNQRKKSTPVIQQICFHTGTLVGLLALVSPLDELGDEYLFSAHMVQHLLLMFITAPLWLIGTPGWLLEKIIPQRLIQPVQWLMRPIPAFLSFTGVILLWHIPAIYEKTLEFESVHILEHVMFLGGALIGWWLVAGADTTFITKPSPPLRMMYLFLLALPCTLLAAVLTFSRVPLYSFYISAPHNFGLDALQDQHLGGLLMWMPTHMVLLLALGITFFVWFAHADQERHLAQVN